VVNIRSIKMKLAEIKIVSAGAVKPGLSKVIAAFQKETGYEADVLFATAPVIAERIGSGESFDIVVAPPRVLDELNMGQLPRPERITIGRIGVGMMVRDGVPLPQIVTVEDFKRCLLSAESLVYNQASTGIYLAALFDRLGIGAEVNAKSTRYADFAAVLDHINKGSGREIGFGATPVIIENKITGVQFAGSLSEEIQNYTTYAAVVAASDNTAPAQEFARYLASSAAKSLLSAAGIA